MARTAYDILEKFGNFLSDEDTDEKMKAEINRKLKAEEALTEVEIIYLAVQAEVLECDCGACIIAQQEKKAGQVDVCFYCGEPFPFSKLRPYGPAQQNICHECGRKPENNAVTEREMTALTDRARAEARAMGGGTLVFSLGKPPRVMKEIPPDALHGIYIPGDNEGDEDTEVTKS